ncbi:MAG: zinc ribbon domain-containing protein [Desulfovibrionaceae bacterium]|nr:zinc ribbon domain-containing protein [Desulfovibrionaceae bacterium]MDD4952268.1 zinc ribbon domain-containing protein [Desulfovibrionaceae bacterium]
MPIYEYRCRACGHSFEDLAPAGREHRPKCPQCKGREVERVLSVFSGGPRKKAAAPAAGCKPGGGFS